MAFPQNEDLHTPIHSGLERLAPSITCSLPLGATRPFLCQVVRCEGGFSQREVQKAGSRFAPQLRCGHNLRASKRAESLYHDFEDSTAVELEVSVFRWSPRLCPLSSNSQTLAREWRVSTIDWTKRARLISFGL